VSVRPEVFLPPQPYALYEAMTESIDLSRLTAKILGEGQDTQKHSTQAIADPGEEEGGGSRTLDLQVTAF
jgi:hypothetical protein